VSVTLTFDPASGGAPVTHRFSIVVRSTAHR
jgi:hypothetical protein